MASQKPISERLLDAELAINNSMNYPEILDAVTPFGYDLIRLQAAHDLYEETLKLVELQKKEYGEQYEATAVVQRKWDAARPLYANAIKIARLVFKDNEDARNTLGLKGARKQSINGWLAQARLFYNNIVRYPIYIADMAPYTYNQLKLEAEAAVVEDLAVANEMQEHERGGAQEATKLRDAKLDELDQWLAAYKIVSEVALSDTPQMLEQLGWVVPS